MAGSSGEINNIESSDSRSAIHSADVTKTESIDRQASRQPSDVVNQNAVGQFGDFASGNSQIIELTRKGVAWFYALSQREQGMVVAGALVLMVVGLNQAYTPIRDVYTHQADRLAELHRHATAAPAVVERYSRLGARREQLEKRFKEIEFKEGALSYIENLVRQQPGVAPGFDIREGTPKAFGKSFEQQPFLVRFQTTNAAGFVEFLRSVTRGERSLLISKLEIQKPRRGDRLEVDLELNTIRQKS